MLKRHFAEDKNLQNYQKYNGKYIYEESKV